MYTKIQVNGKEQPVDVSELEFYCNCPKCGKEVHVDAFWEWVMDEDFDPYETAAYCDDCHDMLNTMREHVQGMAEEALWNMPANKVEEAYNLLAPYYNLDSKDE